MTPERLEEIKKIFPNVGIAQDLITALEEAWAEVERLKHETIYRTEYEVLSAQVQYQRRQRKRLIQEARAHHARAEMWYQQCGRMDDDIENITKDAEQAEAERDRWMGQFDEAEHRGLAYMEERDELVAEVERWKFDADTTREAHICTGRERDRLAAKLKEYEAFNEPLRRVYNENTAEEATP